jgi:hypothetical protein
MRLRERRPDPEVQRELDALDAALRGERVDPDLADLAALAGELREARPTASIDFGAELDAWAAEGFPSAAPPRQASGGEAEDGRKRASKPGLLARLRARPFAPLATGAAAIVLAGAVGTAVVLNQADQVEQLSGGEALEALEDRNDSAGEDFGNAIAPVPSGTTVPPGTPTEPIRPRQERKQELSASMALSTEPDEVDDVADGVDDVVDTYRGIVVSSNVSTNADRGRATFDLRIPAQNLQAALADLSDLASVTSRDEGVLDVTAPFVTAEERFDGAKAEVDALVAQLADADSQTEIDSIKARLAPARAELAATRAELAGLKQRTDFARLGVTVVGEGDADGWSIGDAADDAGSVLEDIVGAGLVALAVIVPLGALALAGGFGLRAYRRRSRERALDE